MAILGTFIDIQTSSRAADLLASTALAGTALNLTTSPHSLPATNPESVFMQLRSVQVGADYATPQLVGLGGNASLATIGFVGGGVSQNTFPTVMFDVVCITYHSIIR